jgi:hypothetical protein
MFIGIALALSNLVHINFYYHESFELQIERKLRYRNVIQQTDDTYNDN